MIGKIMYLQLVMFRYERRKIDNGSLVYETETFFLTD